MTETVYFRGHKMTRHENGAVLTSETPESKTTPQPDPNQTRQTQVEAQQHFFKSSMKTFTRPQKEDTGLSNKPVISAEVCHFTTSNGERVIANRTIESVGTRVVAASEWVEKDLPKEFLDAWEVKDREEGIITEPSIPPTTMEF